MSRASAAVPLHRLLARAARHAAGVTFLDRAGREDRHSYAALNAGAFGLRDVLAGLGVRPGDRVALVLPTGPAFYYALFGAQALGAVPVPLYPPTRLGQLEEYLARTQAMLEAVQARVVLTTGALAGLLAPALQAARPRCTHLAMDAASVLRATSAEAHATHGAPDDGAHSLDDVALLQFSSGTTAAPKAVALTHRQVLANVSTIAEALYARCPPADGRHTSVSWLPLYHDMGLMGSLMTSVYDAAELTLMPPEAFVGRPASWLQALSRTRATVGAAPNFAYALCTARVRDEDLDGVDLSAWRVALNGAEAVQAETMRAFAERFARWGFAYEAFTPVYGLAEAALAVSFANLDAPCRVRRYATRALRRHGRAELAEEAADGAATRELVSLGRPLPGYAVRVVRDGGGIVAPCVAGEVGRVQFSGPSAMAGYWPVTQATVRPTWLPTGDLGFVDEDGELVLVGRDKDVLVVRGENLAPEELERAADREPEVRTGCCVAGSSYRAGAATEAVTLLVELRGKLPTGAEAEALRGRLRRRVAADVGVRLDEVVLLAPGTLPRTSSGKKRRAEALRRHEAGELRAPRTPRAWRLVLRSLAGRARLWHRGAGRRPPGSEAHP